MKTVFLTFALMVAAHASAAEMKITSTQIKGGAQIANDQVFNSFGCSGANVSPDLKWSGAPAGTKAYALTVYDPDAPSGSGWWHWVVFNIPATVNGIATGAGSGKAAMPKEAIESRTDFGKPGYGGPCPPPGKPHRYIFRVVALKDVIPLDKEASGAMVGFYINNMKLAEGTIEAKYGR